MLMDKAAFMAAYGGIFEHSSWIAGLVWERGLRDGSVQELHAAFSEAIRSADQELQLALLRAHPQLACGLASGSQLTTESRSEQHGAGLDQCSAEEFREFEHLNSTYTDKFGFPFIIAVRGLSRGQILEAFRARLSNEPGEEFQEALEQVIRIGKFRLRDTAAQRAAVAPDFTLRYIDLAQPRLGAEVIEATDDFFAPKERLISPEAPVFIPDRFDDHGKWMDGWESRRKRGPGHDHCIVRLRAGTIHGVDIDTSHFTGNFPPQASIDVCRIDGRPDENTQWRELLPKTGLRGDSHHYLPVQGRGIWTHARLNIYPDGGVAQLRIFGVAHYDWSVRTSDEWVDLAAMVRGGRALECNDMHYGHMSNLIAPGHGLNMGDGWETRRRREPGNDWVILKLAHPGQIRRVDVDTAFFKGNYPSRCSLHGLFARDTPDEQITTDSPAWREILPPVELGPDRLQLFEKQVIDIGVVSHVRFDIFPDGGVSRLRLFGDWDPRGVDETRSGPAA
jgi:allantoicase